MPRFFFHVYDDLDVEDLEGVELPDPEAARDAAIHSARALMCDTLIDGHLVLHHRIEIADEQKNVIESIHFRDVVQIQA